MGKAQNETAQYHTQEQEDSFLELIDFMYCDFSRVNSYLSQLEEGTLVSVSKKIVGEEGKSSITEGIIELPIIFKGQVSDQRTNKSVEEEMESYDPYHSKILKVLIHLSEGLERLDNNKQYIGELALFYGKLKVISTEITDKVIQTVIKHKKVIGNYIDKEAEAHLKALADLMKCSNHDILIHLYGEEGLAADGILASEYMLLPVEDLIRNYAGRLPGEWYVLGLFDSVEMDKEIGENALSIDRLVQAYTLSMEELSPTSHIKVIPIVIYRKINI